MQNPTLPSGEQVPLLPSQADPRANEPLNAIEVNIDTHRKSNGVRRYKDEEVGSRTHRYNNIIRDRTTLETKY